MTGGELGMLKAIACEEVDCLAVIQSVRTIKRYLVIYTLIYVWFRMPRYFNIYEYDWNLVVQTMYLYSCIIVRIIVYECISEWFDSSESNKKMIIF